MRSSRWLVGALGPPLGAYVLVAAAGACSNVDTTIAPPSAINLGVTAVSVDPATFLGGVTCSNVDGGMASYVATITDVSDPENPFTLPSSPPTPCSQLIYFQNVNPYDYYTAQIDGYTQEASQLVPLCGALPPGAVQSCTLDSQCAPAYGCQGTCKVTTYEDLSVSCLQGCGATTDQTNCAVKCAHPAGGGPPPNGTDVMAAFQTCLSSCGFDLDADAGCVNANNNYCVTTEFPALQNDCPTQPTETFVDGGIVRGAVKACSCTYTATEGSRQVFLASQPDATLPVTPPWTTSCAEGAAVQSQPAEDVPIEPCVPLAGIMTGSTGLQVIADATLGELSCGPDGGITGFSIVPADPSLPTYTNQPCPSGSGVTYENVTPETSYTFTIYGFQGGATPTVSTDCVGFPIFGTVTTAQCDVLLAVSDAGADAGVDAGVDAGDDGG